MSNSIIECIYEASSDPCVWEFCLADLAKKLQASHGQLLVIDQIRRCPIFSVTGTPDTGQSSFRHKGNRGLSAALLAAAKLQGINGWRTQSAYFPMDTGEFCAGRDTFVRYGRGWILANRIALRQDVQVLMGFYRLSENYTFSEWEQKILEELAEHLGHSGNQLAKYFSIFGRTHPGYDALNHLPMAFVIADCESHVYFSNNAAGKLFSEADGLVLAGNQLRATTQPQILRDAIQQAIARNQHRVLMIARHGELTPYQLTVSPLPNTGLLSTSSRRPYALVKITLPEYQPVLKQDLLVDLYGLTPAESRLAAGLFEGKTPADYATDASVSIYTVRTQIRSIFEKTNTKRQVELIKLLTMQTF